MIIILIKLCVFLILQGYIEQNLFRTGGRPWLWLDAAGEAHERKKLFGWLIASYHIPLGASWLCACSAAGAEFFLPAACVVQDWAFFRFHPSRLESDSWVNGTLGGWYIIGDETSRNNWWLPFNYVAGIALSIAFYLYGITLIVVGCWLAFVALRIAYLFIKQIMVRQ